MSMINHLPLLAPAASLLNVDRYFHTVLVPQTYQSPSAMAVDRPGATTCLQGSLLKHASWSSRSSNWDLPGSAGFRWRILSGFILRAATVLASTGCVFVCRCSMPCVLCRSQPWSFPYPKHIPTGCQRSPAAGNFIPRSWTFLYIAKTQLQEA